MRNTLINAESEAHLDEFGFAIVPFLDQALIDELSAAHRELGEAPDDPQVALYFGFHSKASDYKWNVHRRLISILHERAETTFDSHDVYLAIFITKWPGPNSGFGPHQDPTLVDERSYRGVTIWAPLAATGRDETGTDNGMLHVVPGSHRFVSYPRERDVNRWVYSDVEPDILTTRGVGVPTQPGDAIVFDDRLIHYSAPNMTTAPRVVVSLGMRPRESRCVLVRPNASGRMDLYAVDDSSFIDVVASAQHLWTPPGEPIAELDPAAGPVTAAQFATWCDAVATPDGVVTATDITVGSDSVSVDPGLFCAFCGATTDLVDAHRSGQGKAQLQCRTCQTERESAVLSAMAPAPSTGAVGTGLPAGLGTANPELGGRAEAATTEFAGGWVDKPSDVPTKYPATPVLAQWRDDRRLRRFGFTTKTVLSHDVAAELRAWYLGRHPHGTGFEADLNNDDAAYRRDVRTLLSDRIGDSVQRLFRGYQPFLYNFLCKWPGPTSDLYLHQDWMYIDERIGGSTFVVWVPLQDVTGHNGQLRVLRGSHRFDRSLRGTNLTSDWVDDHDAVDPLLESVPVHTGEAVIMNNALVHSSYANNTTEPRVVVAIGMRPVGAPLTYFRRTGDAAAERYDVDEDFFCEYTPARLAGEPPQLPVAERIRVAGVQRSIAPTELRQRVTGR